VNDSITFIIIALVFSVGGGLIMSYISRERPVEIDDDFMTDEEYMENLLNDYKIDVHKRILNGSKDFDKYKKKQENKHERLIEVRDRAIKDLYGEED